MKITLPILSIFCLLCTSLYAQKQLKGRVINSLTNEPVNGATIKMTRSGNLSSSNIDGTFMVTIGNLPDTLSVSFIGFKTVKQLISVVKTENLLISLIPFATDMKEVVVSTGYQNIPKERATGSFTVIDNRKLNEQVSTDILSRLESVASGVVFNRATASSPQIQVRGLSTINGPTSPLIVLDNFPYEGDLTNINPNDVESITVLKDAAAASIWGTRAGNGVIVITTKHSKFNQPLSIDFNSNLTIGQKPDLSYIRQIATGDFIDLEKSLYKQGFYDSQISDPRHPGLTPVIELLSSATNGTITDAEASKQIEALRNTDVRNDFNKYLYRQSVNQQYSLSIKGGSDVQSWLFSSGYDNNLSNLSANYDRLNLHLQNSFKPLARLQIGTNFYYTQSNNSSGRPGYTDITANGGSLYPYAKFADASGNPLPLEKDFSLSYLSTLQGQPLADWKYYPLTDYQHSGTKTNLQDIVANLSANYQIFKFLNFSAQYQYQRQNITSTNLQDQDSYAVRNYYNGFTQIDPSGNVVHVFPAGGYLTLGHTLTETQNIRGQFNADKTWGKNEISGIAGAEIRQVNTTGDQNSFYGYNGDILTYSNVDLANPYPNLITGDSNFLPDNKGLTSLSNRFVSVFANASYTYNSKYVFSISGRRDASNLFGVNTNNKWNPLGSAGLAWDLSKEDFYKVTFVPYLRLRATYGLSGNVNLSQTAVSTIRYTGNSPYTRSQMAVFNTFANPELRWETSAMLNLAADFSAFNDRISGSIEYFRKNNKNLFGISPVDYTSGTAFTVVRNVAEMKGKGVDLTLTSRNLTGEFKWSSTLNFSLYKDEITKYYLNDQTGNSFVVPYGSTSGVVGKPVYAILSFKSAGLDPANGNPRGYENGQISEDYSDLYYNTQLSDLKYSGPALPTKYGSFSNTFSYKSISFTVNVTYKLGYYFKKSSVDYGLLTQNGQGNSDYALRWQKPGDQVHTSVPSYIYPDVTERDAFYTGSESLVEKGDHIRLQYVTLSYEVSKKQHPLLPFRSVLFYSNMSNLGIIWRANKDHIDPDYNYGTALKPPLTISFGIKASY